MTDGFRNGGRKGKVAVVYHRKLGSPGAIGQWLVRSGYEVDARRPKYGDSLPADLESYSGVIVFGGPESANDDHTYMKAEMQWIGRVLEADMPYLGVCLGGQMLARLLGGEVGRHGNGAVERGYYPIRATEAGEALCGPWPEQVYHWHQEGFTIPGTARPLAVSEGAFPNQAFQYGARAIGLQFHPEITYMLVNRWSRRPLPLMAPGAVDRPKQFAQHLMHGHRVRDWLDRFLQNWLEADRV